METGSDLKQSHDTIMKKIIPTQLVPLQGPIRSKFYEYILHAYVQNLMSELKTIFIINFS